MITSFSSAIRCPLVALLLAVVLAFTLSPALAQTSNNIDAIAEIQRLETEFLKSRYTDLTFFINLALAAIAVVFSFLAFFGLRSIKDAKEHIEEARKAVEKLEHDAQEHLATIERVRGETDDWSTEMATAIDDIADLRERLSELQVGLEEVNPKLQIKQSEVATGAARDRMLDALSQGNYRWRSIERLASIAGVNVEQAANILRPLTNEVVFGRGKSGRTIVGLTSRVR